MFPRKIKVSQPLWFLGLLLLLVFLPLPFGSNRPWAADFFGLSSGALLLAMLWRKQTEPSVEHGAPPRRRLWIAAASLSLVLLWAFFQTVSFSPESWQHPIWREAAQLLGPVNGAISVVPGAFTESMIRLLGYVAVFLLAFFGGRDRARAMLLVRTLAYAGLVYAFYGLFVQSLGNDTILWFKKWAYQGFLTSTFVNKNSYAVYAGLGLLCAAVVVRERLKHIVIKDKVLAKSSPAAAWFASLQLSDMAVLCAPVIFLAALALTGSRAGVLSSLFGMAILFLCIAVYRRLPWQQWLMLMGGVVVLLILFIGMGGDALLARLDESKLGTDSATRLAAYDLVKQAISDNPWLGFGLGSFDGAFRLYRDSTLPVWFHHAHNDYLELAMDLGVPFALLLFLPIGLMVSCCVEGLWRRRRDAIYPALAVAASGLIGVHVLVDFSMHIPAIAATYAALLGVGVAQSFSSRQAAGEEGPSLSRRKGPSIVQRIAPEGGESETANDRKTEEKEAKATLVPRAPSPQSRRRAKHGRR